MGRVWWIPLSEGYGEGKVGRGRGFEDSGGEFNGGSPEWFELSAFEQMKHTFVRVIAQPAGVVCVRVAVVDVSGPVDELAPMAFLSGVGELGAE